MLQKRKWVYIQQPKDYEMPPCSCGNEETQWSEYEKHLWCDKCQKDFIPKHGGVFDGPIPFNAAKLLGITFDRFNLETNQVELVDEEEIGNGPILYVTCHKPEDIFSTKRIPVDIKKYKEIKESHKTQIRIEVKKGAISFSKGSFHVELFEEFSDGFDGHFATTIKIGYPNTKNFFLYFDKADDNNLKIRSTSAFKEFKKFVLINELNYDLKINESKKKASKL